MFEINLGVGLIVMGFVGFFVCIPSIVCAEAASRKGLSPVGCFLFSLIFTPILGFLAVIAFPSKK